MTEPSKAEQELREKILGSLINIYSLFVGEEEPNDIDKEYIERETAKLIDSIKEAIPELAKEADWLGDKPVYFETNKGGTSYRIVEKRVGGK